MTRSLSRVQRRKDLGSGRTQERPSPSLSSEPANRPPSRIQRKRTKGWKMPEGVVYVGRPTVWSNPFTIEEMGRYDAVEAFRRYVTGPLWEDPNVRFDQQRLRARISALRGNDLACWCPLDKPCHADVLPELANREDQG